MKSFLFPILFAFFLVDGYAQRLWTLEECIQYAIENNISIKQLELQKQTAEVELNTTQMSRLPDLNAGVYQEWRFGKIEYSDSVQKKTSALSTTTSSTSFSLTTNVPLFTGFRIPNEIAKNKLDVQAAMQSLERAKEDLSINVTSLFLQVLFSKEIYKINEEQLALSMLQIERTRTLVEVGKAPQSQLYDIEAQVASDEVALIEAENNLKLALLDLAQSLELEKETEFDIIVPEYDNVVESFMGSLKAPALIYENALAVKPIIKEQEYKLKSAEKSLNIAKSGYYPTLDLRARLVTGYDYIYDGLNSSFSDQINDRFGQYIELSLNIPIFNRFSVRNRVKSAKINISNQELTLESTKKELYKEIQTAYTNAAAAQKKYVAAAKAIKASSESFNYAKERYAIGKSTAFEYDEARTRFMKNLSEEVQAKYEYILKAKILDFYNGTPIRL